MIVNQKLDLGPFTVIRLTWFMINATSADEQLSWLFIEMARCLSAAGLYEFLPVGNQWRI